jgi:hypothetical protein
VKCALHRTGLEIAALLLAVLTAACMLEPSRPYVPFPGAPDGSVDTSAPVDSRPLWTLSGAALGLKDLDRIPPQPHLVPLLVPGFPEAVVAPPLETSEARPVVVVLHGMGDRPEPHCEAWRAVTRAHAFVLCPRGNYDPER